MEGGGGVSNGDASQEKRPRVGVFERQFHDGDGETVRSEELAELDHGDDGYSSTGLHAVMVVASPSITAPPRLLVSGAALCLLWRVMWSERCR